MDKQHDPSAQLTPLPSAAMSAARRPCWHLVISVLLTLAISAAVWHQRVWLGDAIALARAANPFLIGSTWLLILLSYLVSSHVFHIALRSLGQRVGFVRLWATTITAIVISQSIPAGGIGSYTFFVSVFKRHGIAPHQARLLATLEALSYAGAMLLIGAFSVVYLAVHTVGGAAVSQSLAGPGAAVAVATAVVGSVAFVITRSEGTITRWVLAISGAVQRLLRRPRSDDRARTVAAEFVRSRAVIVAQPRLALAVILIQIAALCGHSGALWLVLRSLHATVSPPVAVAAFGVALITSTFNVLPGGGGTVETILVAVLLQFGVGAEAVPAAIVFRLLNFWALLPLAATWYGWLMRPAQPVVNDAE